MNYYLNISLKIFGVIFLLYLFFLMIVLCINDKELKIKNSNRRKVHEKYKNKRINKVSEKMVTYGKKLGDTFKIKKDV